MDLKFTYSILLAAFSIMGSCNNTVPATEKTEQAVAITPAADTAVPKTGEYNPEDDPTLVKQEKVVIKPEELPISRVGELVLKDSIKVYDNEVITFMLFDSLLSPKKKSRDFYFKVFNKMMDRSGGKMGDAIGDYALTYVESYPREFLANSKNFTQDRMDTWASNIGIELFLLPGNKKEAYEKSIRTFTNNCKNCDTADLARLNTFNKLVLQTIEQNLKGRELE